MTQRHLIGEVIRSARLARGWTAEQAADQAGIAQKTWARLETGLPIRAATTIAAARLFDLPDRAILQAIHGPEGPALLAAALGITTPTTKESAAMPHQPIPNLGEQFTIARAAILDERFRQALNVLRSLESGVRDFIECPELAVQVAERITDAAEPREDDLGNPLPVFDVHAGRTITQQARDAANALDRLFRHLDTTNAAA